MNGGIDQRLFDYLSCIPWGKRPLPSSGFGNWYVCLPAVWNLEVLTEEKHCNPLGLLHGGLIMSIADAAMGNAIRSWGLPG